MNFLHLNQLNRTCLYNGRFYMNFLHLNKLNRTCLACKTGSISDWISWAPWDTDLNQNSFWFKIGFLDLLGREISAWSSLKTVSRRSKRTNPSADIVLLSLYTYESIDQSCWAEWMFAFELVTCLARRRNFSPCSLSRVLNIVCRLSGRTNLRIERVKCRLYIRNFSTRSSVHRRNWGWRKYKITNQFMLLRLFSWINSKFRMILHIKPVCTRYS